MIRQVSTGLLWLNRSGFALIVASLLFVELTRKYHSIDGDDEERRDLFLLSASLLFGVLEIICAIGAKNCAWKTVAIALGAFGIAWGLQIALDAHDRRLTSCPQAICGP